MCEEIKKKTYICSQSQNKWKGGKKILFPELKDSKIDQNRVNKTGTEYAENNEEVLEADDVFVSWT